MSCKSIKIIRSLRSIPFQQTCYRLSRLLFLFTGLWVLAMSCGCMTDWATESVGIVEVLIPAVTALLGVLATLGSSIPAGVMSQIEKWGQAAVTDLNTVESLIEQYQTAAVADQPGILAQIETIMTTIAGNLEELLPEIHIANDQTQAKVEAIVGAVLNELKALVAIIPVLKGEVADQDEAKARIKRVLTAREFRKNFNTVALTFDSSGKYQV